MDHIAPSDNLACCVICACSASSVSATSRTPIFTNKGNFPGNARDAQTSTCSDKHTCTRTLQYHLQPQQPTHQLTHSEMPPISPNAAISQSTSRATAPLKSHLSTTKHTSPHTANTAQHTQHLKRPATTHTNFDFCTTICTHQQMQHIRTRSHKQHTAHINTHTLTNTKHSTSQAAHSSTLTSKSAPQTQHTAARTLHYLTHLQHAAPHSDTSRAPQPPQAHHRHHPPTRHITTTAAHSRTPRCSLTSQSYQSAHHRLTCFARSTA